MQALSSNGMACGQVLSSIRPVGAAVRGRWPVWIYADRAHIAYASLKALVTELVCPIPSRRPFALTRSPSCRRLPHLALSGRGGDSVVLLPCRQRPDDRIVDDAEFRHVGDDPLLRRIEPRHPLAGRGVLDIAEPVPDQPADVEFVVEQAGAALRVAPDGRVVPELPRRAGDAPRR